MQKTILALVAMATVVMSRVADVLTTLHFDPNLNNEANPFVDLWGFGVTGLMISQVIIMVLVLAAVMFYWKCPAKEVLAGQEYSLREFVSVMLYDKVLPGRQLLAKILCGKPSDWKQTLRLLGLMLPFAAGVGGFVATFSWWAVHEWNLKWWVQLRGFTVIGNYPTLNIIIGAAAATIAGILFFTTEYAEAKKRLEATAASRCASAKTLDLKK